MLQQTGVRALSVLGALVLGAVFAGDVMAGFTAMPLKAELDLAQTVVVGKITDIAKEKEEYEGKLVRGVATVAVSEVLKGREAHEVKMDVAMQMDRDLARMMQSPSHVYRAGDEGIWVIMSDERPSHGYGLLGKDRLQEVKAALEELDKRTWSEEVRGLKVWAAADFKNPQGLRLKGMVVFAVKNVSEKPVYLPRPVYETVLTAVARDSSGKEFPLRGIGMGSSTPEPPLVSQAVLRPGETRYLHPDGENYGFFVIPTDLPPGEYSIIVRLANTVAEGHLGATRNEKPVVLWTGSIAAPVFTIEIPSEPATP